MRGIQNKRRQVGSVVDVPGVPENFESRYEDVLT